MRGTVLYGPGDIRFEDRETPRVEAPTDAVIRIAATCVAARGDRLCFLFSKLDGPSSQLSA
jgi:threonine dehydrogenase-like Zn-dependent dehydrogenase